MTSGKRIVVHVPRDVGGVRHVTDCLARAIEENGRPVERVEDAWGLLRARATGVRDAILSLESGYFSVLFERSIYILHGFPVVYAHSALRRVAVRGAARAARWGGSRLVAVSHLTRAVHEALFGIPVDEVVFNGCSQSLQDIASSGVRQEKRKWVTFVGRLVEGKGVRAIAEAFLASSLPSAGYSLKMAGSGPLAAEIAGISERHPQIEALGEISESEKEQLLFASEAFVSLNAFEPMGVVFVEALLCGCKVIAPFCGGHREFIPAEHPVSLCDPRDLRSIALAFDRIRSLPEGRSGGLATFNYRRTIAPRYLAILDGAESQTAGVSSERSGQGAGRSGAPDA